MNSGIEINVRSYVDDILRTGNLDNVFSFLRALFKDNTDVEKEQITANEAAYSIHKKSYFNGEITHSEFSRQTVIIIRAINGWLLENISESYVWTSYEYSESQGIRLDIDELIKQLHEILNLNGVDVVFFYLERLISGIEKRFHLDSTKEKYQLLVWKSNNQRINLDIALERESLTIDKILEKEKAKRAKIRASRDEIKSEIEALILSLLEEDLINNWRFEYIKKLRNYKLHDNHEPSKALISSLDIIQIPGFLKADEDYKLYKRLMVQAQDAYLIEDYQSAYHLCIEVRDKVDPESSQLYEYLFVTYYNLIGPEKIISEALDDSQGDEHLKRLFLYANRFVRLQSIISNVSNGSNIPPRGANKIAREVQNIHSLTGEDNIKQINSELLLTLAHKYSGIIDTFRTSTIELSSDDKRKIIQCIVVARNITEHIRVDAVFATTIVNELAGGGKHQWIALRDGGKLINTEKQFDAIGHLEDTIRLLSYDKRQPESKIKEGLSKDLYNYLVEKYNFVKAEQTSGNRSESEIRFSLTKVLVSFRVASMLFPQSKLFIEIPIEELGSKGGIISWYWLDYNRQLNSNTSRDYQYYFDPVEFLQYFLTYGSGTDNTLFNWEQEKGKLLRRYYELKSDNAESRYLNIDVKDSYLLKDTPHSIIEDLINVYRDWRICYDVYKEEHYLWSCYNELVGNSKCFWFLFGANDLKDYPIYAKFNEGFSPVDELAFLVENIHDLTEKEAYRVLAINYLDSYIKPRNYQIKSITRFDRNSSISYKLEIFNFIEQLMVLLNKSGYVDQVCDYIFEEIVKESTFNWLDFSNGEISDLEINYSHAIESKKVLYKLIDISSNFDESKIKDIVMSNRLKEYSEKYDQNFSRIKKHNYYEGDILEIVEILEKLVYYYNETKDPKYLKLPYKELVEGKGKIRWATYGIKILSWWPFDYKFGRVRSRRLIREIGDFDFFEMKVFVKKEYEKTIKIANKLRRTMAS